MSANQHPPQPGLFGPAPFSLDADDLPPVEVGDATAVTALLRALSDRIASVAEHLEAADSDSRHATSVYVADALERVKSMADALVQQAVVSAADSGEQALAETIGLPSEHGAAKQIGGDRAAAWSLGAALLVSEFTASSLIARSRRSVTLLPNGQARLLAGDWMIYQQRMVLEMTAHLDDGVVRQLDADVFAASGRVSVPELRGRIQKWLRRNGQPSEAEQTRRQGPDQRHVGFGPVDLFGMRPMGAYLRALEATMIETTLHEIAGTAPADDERTKGQILADTFVALFTGPNALAAELSVQLDLRAATADGPDGFASVDYGQATQAQEIWRELIRLALLLGMTFPKPPATTLNLHVPIQLLRGDPGGESANPATGPPAWIDRIGTVPDDVARYLARDSDTIRRIITAPGNQVLDYGRKRRLPPAVMASRVRVRDRCCRFPGCHRLALDADIDHVRPYASGGATADANLQALCASHHQAKHRMYWHATLDPDTAEVTWRNRQLGITRVTSAS